MFALEPTEALVDEGHAAEWRALARCSTGTGTMLELFFSEQIDDINRAKAFCAGCEVRTACLDAALERAEPWGVWGGELFVHGKVIAQKRKRGRPPKVRPPEPAPLTDAFDGLLEPVGRLA